LKHETAHDYSTAGIVHRCGVNLPDATENGLPIGAANRLGACFRNLRHAESPLGARIKACVLPPTAIDAFLEQRYDIHAYRTSGRASDILSSIDARLAMAALTKSELNAIGRATLLASLDGKVG